MYSGQLACSIWNHILIFGIYCTVTRFTKGGFSKICVFLAIILSIMTESYLTGTIIYIIALYSYSRSMNTSEVNISTVSNAIKGRYMNTEKI